MKRIAFLVSGNGTNMENLVRTIQAGGVPNAQAAVVISDNPNAGAIERAKKLGVETVVIERKQFADKKAFEEAMTRKLEIRGIDLIVLAGFMRILSKEFVEKYKARIINIHPSLLPRFPGAKAIEDAFDAKVKETGVTVHFVDSGVDTGPVIIQESVSVSPNDTLESLEAKIHEVEYILYPVAVRMVLSGQAKYDS